MMSAGISNPRGEAKVNFKPRYNANSLTSECTVRPYLRSPTTATWAPSKSLPRRENSVKMVYKSSNAWLGCSPEPSPPLTTGILVAAANSATEPCSGWRMTIASTYPPITRLVSYIDSPLAIDEQVNPVVSQTDPPKRQKAAPKLTRVRVLASKTKLPSTAPSSTRETFWRLAMGCIISAI